MIAMSMLSTYDEYRRDSIASVPVCPAPTHPLRYALIHALVLGMGGVAAVDEDEAPGIG